MGEGERGGKLFIDVNKLSKYMRHLKQYSCNLLCTVFSEVNVSSHHLTSVKNTMFICHYLLVPHTHITFSLLLSSQYVTFTICLLPAL